MKKLNRVENKFLWSSVELYRYDSRTETFDAKDTFWLRTVKQIYFNDHMSGYWIDGQVWMNEVFFSLFNKKDYSAESRGLCNLLHDIAEREGWNEDYRQP